MDNEQKLIKNPETPLELAETCIKILDNRRARNMKLLRVDEKTIIADYFIICWVTPIPRYAPSQTSSISSSPLSDLSPCTATDFPRPHG